MAEIRVERLTKSFKELNAVDDVTFSFPESQVTCLLGPSGCGKTTLMRMIAGLETPTNGEIYFGNQRVTRLKPSQRDIGMVFQYPVVYRGISVRRNIELPLLSMKLDQQERERRITRVVEILSLQRNLEQDITQLDNGTRQKVAVAREVARQPRIILFDEPITNVDAHSKLLLKRAFKELTRQLQQTIIYVTHDQTEAMTLADQIALMQAGKIVQCDAPRTLYNHPADRFGGWFLGNPGMNFFEVDVRRTNGTLALVSPLFPEPVPLQGTASDGQTTLGIRPEDLRLSRGPRSGAVEGRVVRKSITIGGQYLVAVAIGEQTFKAKTPAAVGQSLDDTVWIELPLARITLFTADGHRADLTPVASSPAELPS
ncbi:MAG: ABC transporter ATP-binding protein [Thermomicrobiales bacterium]